MVRTVAPASPSCETWPFGSRRRRHTCRFARMDDVWSGFMRGIKDYRDAITMGLGVVAPLGVAAILAVFRASLANSAAALILVAVVVAIAANGNRMAGYFAAISASLWFDFFLTTPYEHFAITHRPDIETAISLFVVGLAVTELAARNRFHRRVAGEESDYVGLIYYLSELVAAGTPSDRVIEHAVAELVELMHLRQARFEPGQSDGNLARIEGDGQVHLANSRWRLHQLGLPGSEVELDVITRGQTLGRFVLVPTPGVPVSLQRRVVAVAIADLVGASLAPQLRSA